MSSIRSQSEYMYIPASWCSCYRYCTISFNKSLTRVLPRFMACLEHSGNSRWWRSLTVVLARKKDICLSPVNRTTRPQEQFISIITNIHTYHYMYHSNINLSIQISIWLWDFKQWNKNISFSFQLNGSAIGHINKQTHLQCDV